MTLDVGLVAMGVGILGFCAIEGVLKLLKIVTSRSQKRDNVGDVSVQTVPIDLPERDEELHDFEMISSQLGNGVYSHAVHLFDRGLSVRQVRKKIDLPKGEMELLIRMQEIFSIQ